MKNLLPTKIVVLKTQKTTKNVKPNKQTRDRNKKHEKEQFYTTKTETIYTFFPTINIKNKTFC